MTSDSSSNGRATIRDVMALQREMFTEVTNIRSELGALKLKVYVNAAVISIVVSILVVMVAQAIK